MGELGAVHCRERVGASGRKLCAIYMLLHDYNDDEMIWLLLLKPTHAR